MRRLPFTFTIAALLAGCSSSSPTTTAGPGTSTAASAAGSSSTSSTVTTAGSAGTAKAGGDAYCAVIARINDGTKKDKGKSKSSPAEIDAVLTDMRAAKAAAPDLEDAWQVLIDGATKLAKLSDDADPSEALAIVLDKKFEAAVTTINDETKKTCGFGVEAFSQPIGSNQEPTGTGGLLSSCNDLVGAPGPEDDPRTSIVAVRTALCETQRDAPWFKAVVVDAAWSSKGGEEPQWTVVMPVDQAPEPPLSAAQASDACNVLDGYLLSVGVDAAITIGTGSMDNLPNADTVLAAKKPKDTCRAV